MPRSLPLPRPSVVVIAGLPGAGKTTMLRRVADTDDVLALDAEGVVRRKPPLPYAVLRPFIHAAHLTRVLLALGSTHACVLTTDPMTSPRRRRVLRAAARVTGRRLYVVLLHVTPEEARAGQRSRGRVLGRRRMLRHERRYDAILGDPSMPVDVLLTRDEAAHVHVTVQRQDASMSRAGLSPSYL